ncbi:hypothetical protein BGZ83_003518, partial [Gryganskiella cystojenkinii]
MLPIRVLPFLALAAALMLGSTSEAKSSIDSCVQCIQVVPQCKPCAEGYHCEVSSQDCRHCASARCVQDEGVSCIQQEPECGSCANGFRCEVTPQTLTACASARCVK